MTMVAEPWGADVSPLQADVTRLAADVAPLAAPDLWIQMLEQGVLFEAGALYAASPLLRSLGRGDHHPVFVMPGFLGDDSSTVPLRFFIRAWGYWAHGMHGGQNLGPTPKVLARIEQRLIKIHRRHGRKISLVGWSAGGQYARHLARLHPEMIRQVITLATPLQFHRGDRSSVSFVADRLERFFDPDFGRLAEHERGPLPVPATSIYSRTDGVVRWQTCLDIVDDRHHNVEVHATHCGMGINPAALAVVADRLSQAEDDWRPFYAPSWLRSVYPRPESWRPAVPQLAPVRAAS
jgi:pimeloyl-ACP methyl ester carboxylesterase